MKKKLKILMIVTIILLMTIGIISVVIAGTPIASYNNMDTNVIYGSWYENGRWRPIKYVFNAGKNSAIAYETNGNKIGTVTTIKGAQYRANDEGGKYIPLISQPNVWCVENGKDIYVQEAEWKIGEEITVEDPILAYILAKGTVMGSLETTYKNAAQIALWYYLTDDKIKTEDANGTLTDKGRILKDIICKNPNNDSTISLKDKEEGASWYTAAKDYATKFLNTDAITKNDFKVELVGNKLIIEPQISGFNSYDITINGNKKPENCNCIGRKEIDVSTVNAAELVISIDIKYNATYAAKYRVLRSTGDSNQRILVSTYTNKDNDASKSIPLDSIDKPSSASVSLEKYITKVKSAVNGSETLYSNREWKRYNEDDTNNQNLYKSKNPIEVEIGDEIEYTIKLTNTSTESALNLSNIEMIDIPGNGLECVRMDANGWGATVQTSEVRISPTSTNTTLSVGESIDIKIYFKVSDKKDENGKYKYLNKKISNKAKVIGTNGMELTEENDKDGRGNNTDSDFIEVLEYKVGIQKYITKVNGQMLYDYSMYDVNYDGFLDELDILHMQYAVGKIEDSSRIKEVDFNGDGKIDITDVTPLQKIISRGRGLEGTEDNLNTDVDNFKIREGSNEPTIVDGWFKRFNYVKYEELLGSDNYKGNEAKLIEDLNGSSELREVNHISLRKLNYPVEVEPGVSSNPTKITYTIQIRNEKEPIDLMGEKPGAIGITQIKDKPQIGEGVKLDDVRYIPRGTISNYNIEVTEDDNHEYTIKFNEPVLIGTGTPIYIDVEVDLVYTSNNYEGTSVILRNEARIEESTITNSQGKSIRDADGDVNNADCDFIKLKSYAVSLEKFITEVTDKDGNNKVQYNDRAGKRYNDDNKLKPEEIVTSGTNVDKITRYTGDDNKKENKVKVEPGDIVKYTIRLKNTGSTKVRITQIYDSYTYKENGLGIKLEPILRDVGGTNELSILDKDEQKNIRNTIINDNYGTPSTTVRRYLIEFNTPIELEPGSYKDMDIKCKVTIPTDKTASEPELQNKAGIVEIKNINNILVRDSDGEANNYDMDWVKLKKYQASLEKYIVGVQSTGKTGTNLIKEPGPLYNCDNVNRSGHTIYKKLSNGNNDDTKQEDPVNLENGDYVTYRIVIKNTRDNSEEYGVIKNLTIKDNIPEGLEYESFSSNFRNFTINSNKNEIIYFGTLGLNSSTSSVYFDITYKVKEDVTGPIVNTATLLTNLVNKNGETVLDSTDNDNEDKDWVELKKYAVSLEKFITEVTDKDGNNGVQYNNDRAGKRYNNDENGEVKSDNTVDKTTLYNKNDGKYNNKVSVEPGDIVTYTIRLKNTINSSTGIDDKLKGTTVKISEIEDIYTKTSEGVKLECYGDITDLNGEKLRTSVTDNAGGFKITFNSPIELTTENNYKDIQVKFKVIIPEGKTATVQELENKAEIIKIINKNGSSVVDYDGTANNADKDFIKTKIYQASLEKYIVGVQSTGKTGTDLIKDPGPLYNCENVNRNGHTIYNEPVTTNSNTDNIKHKDPVNLEIGDFVTYRIKLTNTGNASDTYGIIKNLKVTDICPQGLEYIQHSNQLVGIDENLKVYTYTGSIGLNSSIYFDITYEVIGNPGIQIENTASLDTNLTNRNDATVIDGDTEYNNVDKDWIETKIYKVSLQKIVHSVNGKNVYLKNATDNLSSFNRWESWENAENRNQSKTGLPYKKYNEPVEVENGNTVTYAIKVTNNHETKVKNIKVKDTLPNGLNLNTLTLKDSNGNNISFNINNNVVEFTLTNELNKNDSITVYMSVIVTEPNISLDVLENYAKIIGTMKNRNNEDVNDSTGNDNQDADYIQMKDIIISGFVWNDKAKDKGQNHYNGQYDEEYEKNIVDGKKTIDEIKVYLYRVSGDNSNKVAETTTNNGEYIFTSKTFDESIAIKDKYIKASKVANNKNSRWNKPQYHSYYVVFEYDGVKYTSTFTQEKDSDGNVTDKIEKRIWEITENDLNNNIMYSNAQENEDDRKTFNNKFSKINNTGAYNSNNEKTMDIDYRTENETGYISQSIYLYNSNMNMQSSTNKITLSKDANLEEQIKHINLGLRGRDIFDLEITSDVYQVNVKVNDRVGVYEYTNKVNLRQTDLNTNDIDGTEILEDMSNIEDEKMPQEYVDGANTDSNVTDNEGQQQRIRNTDFADSGLSEIKVTYKMTVSNASRTPGIATVITNYYDKCYSNPENFILEMKIGEEIKTSNKVKQNEHDNDTSNNIYNRLELDLTEAIEEILGEGGMLQQSESYSVYVTYTMDVSTLKTVFERQNELEFATYNMSEITEYKTTRGEGPTEFTRGLIDKDSAPGSVETEKARLGNPEEIEKDKTTLGYYFGGNNLARLKYEDDTYATPTLYFVSDSSQRIITGTVFEDLTQVNDNKVKSGNGIKDGNDPTIEGITVELYEDGKNAPIASTSTNSDGYYEFKGLLPGNYTIKYYYGDTEATFLKKNGNQESYNGEKFQATNNSYDVEGIPVNKLSEKSDYWYLDNEGIGVSTAFDNVERRETVTDNVINFSDDEMSLLNDAREGKELTNIGTKDDENSLIGRTYMYANTKPMLLNVEKIENPKEAVAFGKYEITNMNFGIAEVPVTIIDLQKRVESFNVTDATGKNIIASASKNAEGKWKKDIIGNVIVVDGWNEVNLQIEDEKLQGARLEVIYGITSSTKVEKNYDNTDNNPRPIIAGLADLIDNNLSYNSELNGNSTYWTVGSLNESSIDISKYKTIVKANSQALDKINNKEKIYITLEKVLSSTDSSLSSIDDSYVYKNIVEITDLNYENVTSGKVVHEDRITTEDGYIIRPGVQKDMSQAEEIIWTTPTGDSSIHTVYYILAAISLAVISIGVFGIKKFVLNNKQ